ncbi:hypothetical protein [Mesorhizobium sp. M0488]|uniref:hypothetical protein n=1 Tax=unclassified Mesorhizobium TaxID=325217 RepID=UPI00333BE01A
MSLLISIFFSVLASIGLTFAKAISVYGFIRDQRYSWISFIAISIGWFGATVLSAYSMCGQLGCSWGLRFGWISDMLPHGFVTNVSSGEKLFMVALLTYLGLCIYFFGHVIGWLSYAVVGIGKVFSKRIP